MGSAATQPTRALLQPAGGDEGVEVPADGGRGDAQPGGELGGGLRAVLQEQGADAAAGTPVVGGGRRTRVCRNAFHNTSVSYFRQLATKVDLTGRRTPPFP
jgi:hypothetical protein